MTCPKCGSEIPDGIRFCPICGAPLQETQQETAAPEGFPNPAPVNSEPQPVYPNPAPVNPEPQPVYQNPAPVYQEPQPVYPNPAPQNPQYAPTYDPVYQQPAPYPAAPAQPAGDNGQATTLLVLGIVGLATAFLPYMLSIAGIIVSAIARGKAKTYKNQYGALTGKAKAGANLAKAGLIVSIIGTVLWLILFIIFAIASAVGSVDFEDVFDLFSSLENGLRMFV